MEKRYRRTLLGLLLLLLGGIALIVGGWAIAPDRELRTGIVVLSTPVELNQFFASVVGNNLESEFGRGIVILKSDLPAVIKLRTALPSYSEFPYGKTTRRGHLTPDWKSGASTASILFMGLGTVLIFLGLLELSILALWPRFYYGKLKLTLTPPFWMETAKQEEQK